jgi:hypothetical protein
MMFDDERMEITMDDLIAGLKAHIAHVSHIEDENRRQMFDGGNAMVYRGMREAYHDVLKWLETGYVPRTSTEDRIAFYERKGYFRV